MTNSIQTAVHFWDHWHHCAWTERDVMVAWCWRIVSFYAHARKNIERIRAEVPCFAEIHDVIHLIYLQLLQDFAMCQATRLLKKQKMPCLVVPLHLPIQKSRGLKTAKSSLEITLLSWGVVYWFCVLTAKTKAGTSVTQRTGQVLNWLAHIWRCCDRWTQVSHSKIQSEAGIWLL